MNRLGTWCLPALALFIAAPAYATPQTNPSGVNVTLLGPVTCVRTTQAPNIFT